MQPCDFRAVDYLDDVVYVERTVAASAICG